MTSKNRTLRGVAAAAVGASVVVLAMVGVEIGASASTADPKSPSCVQAIHAWEQARDHEAGPRRELEAAKQEHQNTLLALAGAEDAYKKEQNETTLAALNKARANEAAAGKKVTQKQRVYDQAQGRTSNAKARADEACKGEAGTPGAPGQPGPVGPAGAPGKDGEVIVQQIPVQSAPVVVREAPAPQVQEQDGTGVIVTH